MQLPDNRYNSYFLDVFERSNRLVICDREENVTTSQALHFVNGPEVHAKIAHADGRLSRWLASARTDRQLLEEMFLATLSRAPAAGEAEKLLARTKAGSRREVFEDILWALVSSKEFVFNH